MAGRHRIVLPSRHCCTAFQRSPPPPLPWQALKSSRTQWQAAIGWYRLAATVLPSSGNPYNQLAVMSYQSGDELRAVYFYFRCDLE